MGEPDILRAIDELELPAGVAEDLVVLVTGVDRADHPSASGDPNRRSAWARLRPLLVRGGKRTRAAAAVTPALLDLTHLDAHPAKPYARMLLADVVACDHVLHLVDGVDLSRPEVKRRYSRGSARAILDEVLADADRLLADLGAPEPSARSSAALLLGFLSPVADMSLGALVECGRRERDPWVQASVMMGGALVARYGGRSLSVAELEGWCRDASTIPRAFAWVAALYSDRVRVELGEAELTEQRAELIAQMFRAGDPDPRLFPWACGRTELLLAWQLAERGESATLFAARILARISIEELPGAMRLALAALDLCFDERDAREPLKLEALDDVRRRVVSLLSQQDYPQIAFLQFGLPSSAADRRRWLGESEQTVLDRAVDVDGEHRAFWEVLADLRRAVTPGNVAAVREQMLDLIDARLEGDERIEARCLLACGANGLHGVVTADDVYAALEEARPARSRMQRMLEKLSGSVRRNLRGSGTGMAMVWALARGMEEGSLLADEYADLVKLSPASRAADVVRRMPQSARDSVAVRSLKQAVASSWNGHLALEGLLEVADLLTPGAVSELAMELAEIVAADSFLKTTSPEEADALRQRVRERFGS
ncbi:MAG: hypothetical protein JXR96_08070 [Deltaproteobacteria bacterium]|nr:hypothetical protein [Deltaproteobacteria bacterium]